MLDAAICLMGVLVLLAAPAATAHAFTNHWRAPEIRRSIERNTFASVTSADSCDCIAAQATEPDALPGADPILFVQSVARPLRAFPPPPVPRLLLRMKLGPHRSGCSEPLLQA